jgi:hypothetical protein
MGATLLSTLLFGACGDDKGGSGNPESSAFEGGGAEGVTYYRDVKPLMDRSCVRCHVDGGISTPLTDPAAVVGLSDRIGAYVASGYMPPPAPDPTCRPYDGSEVFHLTDAERAVFSAWIEGGAPLGDPSDAPDTFPAEAASSDLSYDLVLRPPAPTSPVFDETGNGYTCFVVSTGSEEAVKASAFVPLVDNDQIVHHIVLFGSTDGRGIPDDETATTGFTCNGLGGPGWLPVTAWGPGNQTTQFPDGAAFTLVPTTQYILQMHYYESYEGAATATDQTGYGVILDDSADRAVITAPFGPTSFRIPAGAEAYSKGDTVTWSYGDYEILGSWPHMHVLGSGFQQKILRADGSEDCLLQMDDWDFHSQVTAMFNEAAPITSGDKIVTTCTWDNSEDNPAQVNDPVQEVTFGEGTADEMCFAFTYITAAR